MECSDLRGAKVPLGNWCRTRSGGRRDAGLVRVRGTASLGGGVGRAVRVVSGPRSALSATDIRPEAVSCGLNVPVSVGVARSGRGEALQVSCGGFEFEVLVDAGVAAHAGIAAAAEASDEVCDLAFGFRSGGFDEGHERDAVGIWPSYYVAGLTGWGGESGLLAGAQYRDATLNLVRCPVSAMRYVRVGRQLLVRRQYAGI